MPEISDQEWNDWGKGKMPDLKPCPFCGGEATLKRDLIGQRSPEKWYQVDCKNERCSIRPFTDWHKSRAVVVKEWNRRVTDENA